MPARIRPATTADLFWLRLLLGQLMDATPDAYPSLDLVGLEAYTAVLAARLSSRDPTLLCYVAEDGDVICGFLSGNQMVRIGHPTTYCFPDFFYVAPAYRHQGIGRALSTALIDDARQRGMTMIEFVGQPGDGQWAQRGWSVVGIVYALPIDAAHASVVPRGVPNGAIDVHGHQDLPHAPLR